MSGLDLHTYTQLMTETQYQHIGRLLEFMKTWESRGNGAMTAIMGSEGRSNFDPQHG